MCTNKILHVYFAYEGVNGWKQRKKGTMVGKVDSWNPCWDGSEATVNERQPHRWNPQREESEIIADERQTGSWGHPSLKYKSNTESFTGCLSEGNGHRCVHLWLWKLFLHAYCISSVLPDHEQSSQIYEHPTSKFLWTFTDNNEHFVKISQPRSQFLMCYNQSGLESRKAKPEYVLAQFWSCESNCASANNVAHLSTN